MLEWEKITEAPILSASKKATCSMRTQPTFSTWAVLRTFHLQPILSSWFVLRTLHTEPILFSWSVLRTPWTHSLSSPHKLFENSLHTAYLLPMVCFQSVFPGAIISIVYMYQQRNSSYPEQSYLSNISASSPAVTKPDCYPPSKQIKTLKSLHITSRYIIVLFAYISRLVQPFFYVCGWKSRFCNLCQRLWVIFSM